MQAVATDIAFKMNAQDARRGRAAEELGVAGGTTLLCGGLAHTAHDKAMLDEILDGSCAEAARESLIRNAMTYEMA